MYWVLIIIGTLILSISISNPFYHLIVGKKLKFNAFLQISYRVLLFIVGLIVIFFGLYLESL